MSRLLSISAVLVICVQAGCGAGAGHGAPRGARDGGPPDAGLPFVEAPHPAAPQLVSGGTVLASPHFVPVFFSNDDAALEAQLVTFEQRLGQSAYWTATTSEYGVGPATGGDLVVMDETATGTWTDSDVDNWWRARIGHDPRLPLPDPNTVYVLHFPAGVTITDSDGNSCDGFEGYHTSVLLAGRPPTSVPYALIPRCQDNSDLNSLTAIISHELVEAATDPVPPSGYYATDPDHAYWALAFQGTEAGDMCEHALLADVIPADFPYQLQRTWSNASAAAGHDPCVPALGTPYFNAVPELSHPTTFTAPDGTTLGGLGVLVPEGCTRVVTLDLFSDADTGGPWDLVVTESRAAENGVPSLSLALDRNQGQNGDKLKLTITTTATNPSHAASFVVTSALGLQIENWIGLVDETPGPCPASP